MKRTWIETRSRREEVIRVRRGGEEVVRTGKERRLRRGEVVVMTGKEMQWR